MKAVSWCRRWERRRTLLKPLQPLKKRRYFNVAALFCYIFYSYLGNKYAGYRLIRYFSRSGASHKPFGRDSITTIIANAIIS